MDDDTINMNLNQEEEAVNEKSTQSLKKLVTESDAQIDELEKDLVFAQIELVSAGSERSLCDLYNALRDHTESLDMMLVDLKYDLMSPSEARLLSYRQPAKKLQLILNALMARFYGSELATDGDEFHNPRVNPPSAPSVCQYPEMIMAAIEALDEPKGSNKTTIFKHLESTYGKVQAVHYTIFSDHLTKLKNSGQLVFVRNNYRKPDLQPKKVSAGSSRNCSLSGSGLAADEFHNPRVNPPSAPSVRQYPEMIMAAIEALDEPKGSNKTTIFKHLESTYGKVQAVNYTIFSDHLAMLKNSGQLVFVRNNYRKPDPQPKKVSAGSSRNCSLSGSGLGTDEFHNPCVTPPSGSSVHQYPEMIMAAIDALNEPKGSNKTTILKHLESTYGNAQAVHYTLFSEHLSKLKNSGQLVFVRNNYRKPDPDAPPKRGRPPKPKKLPFLAAGVSSGFPRTRSQTLKERDPFSHVSQPRVSTGSSWPHGHLQKDKPECSSRPPASEPEISREKEILTRRRRSWRPLSDFY